MKNNNNNSALLASIVILNYNGEKVIKMTLDSVFSSHFPENKYEVIVVDNNSTDNSSLVLKECQKKYPQLKILMSTKNAGFSGGNNQGIQISQGKYVILLNNDVSVDANWMKQLVETAESDDTICAVNSKILLFPHFFTLNIETDLQSLPIQAELVEGALTKYAKRKISLFYTSSPNGYALHVPLSPIDSERRVVIKGLLHTNHIHLPLDHFSVPHHPSIVKRQLFVQDNDVHFHIEIDATRMKKHELTSKIQNAGIIMYDNGSGRDRGAVVRYYGQDYEVDEGQYDKEEEVYAACGAALLMRSEVIKKIGGLSEDFFMYYEDVDFCERARLQGYKVVYQPKAIIRHMHALSSEEWSPFFIYHAEKGRLVHIAHHFPLGVFIYEWYMFTLVALMRFFSHFFQREHWIKDIQYVKVSASVLRNFPHYLAYRRKFSPPDKVTELYSSLRDGSWLLS